MNENVRHMRLGDILEVVRIHSEAFPDSRSTLLGKTFLEAEYQWFLYNHPDVALVYRKEEDVVGFVVGGRRGYDHYFFRDNITKVIKSVLLKPRLLFRKNIWADAETFSSSYLRTLFVSAEARNVGTEKTSQTRYLSLASIAVMPSMQGHGIGGLLIQAFEEQAQKLGFALVRLTVKASNKSACQSYEKAGWILLDTRNGAASYYKNLPTGKLKHCREFTVKYPCTS
jgi:ribosomal protein S18 acetylase RimI-like enzyme